MKEYLPLFHYNSDYSCIHRVPAGIKLLFLLIFTIISVQSGFSILTVLSLILIIITICARIPFNVLLAQFRILVWYTVFIVFFKIAGKPLSGEILISVLYDTSRYMWQLALILIAGSIFYGTTSTLDIRHTLSRTQQNLEKGFRKVFSILLPSCKIIKKLPDIGLLLSLTFSFIPRIFDAWSILEKAWEARGGNKQTGIPALWRKMTILVPSLFIKLFGIASDTERAIRNRSA